MDIIQLLMSSQNPQQLAMNLLQQYAPNNPMMNNLLNMIKTGDSNGVERMARNMCSEKGINPDEAVNSLTQLFKKRTTR